jgi:hypothetical protein
MSVLAAEVEKGIESNLIDIGERSLALIGVMRSEVFAAAKRYVVQRAGDVQLCDQNRYNEWTS